MWVRWVEVFQFAINSLEDWFYGTAVKIVDSLEFQIQIAVMTGFVRGGKPRSVRSGAYRLYTRFWLGTEIPRIFCKRAFARLRRLIRGGAE